MANPCICEIATRLGLKIETMESMIVCTEYQRDNLIKTCKAEIENFRVDGDWLIEPGCEWFAGL